MSRSFEEWWQNNDVIAAESRTDEWHRAIAIASWNAALETAAAGTVGEDGVVKPGIGPFFIRSYQVDEDGSEQAHEIDLETLEVTRVNPLAIQHGGEHYKHMPIQPAVFIHSNGIPFLEGCALKYIVRHKSKGKAEDIRKAIHYLQLILKLEYGQDDTNLGPLP